MNQYILTIALPENPGVEYMSLIPAQRDIINKLMNENVISNVSLSENRKTLWLTFNVQSEKNIINHLQTFPMLKYMKINIEKLLFTFTNNNVFPQMSLN